MQSGPGFDEETLISHCKTGSLKHQEMLYKRFYGYAMGIGLRYCFNRDDAMEAVNDAFIKVFKSIGSFSGEKPFKPWLRSVVINTAIDRRRKDMKLQLHTDLEQASQIMQHQSVIDKLNAEDIIKLMQQIPPVQATIFNLYEIDGYSHEEIGTMLGLSTSSSRVYLTRAKDKLRTLLTGEQ